MPVRGRTGFARAAVLLLRHGEEATIAADFATPACRRKDCRQSRAQKEFTALFGNLQAELEPRTKERAAARPALTSPKRTAVDRVAPCRSGACSMNEVAPAASGPTRYPGLCLAGPRLIYPPFPVDFGA